MDGRAWGATIHGVAKSPTRLTERLHSLTQELSRGDLERRRQVFLGQMLCYAKSLQLCPTLCDPIDGSPPGFPVPGILQARTLEWVAISFSNA